MPFARLRLSLLCLLIVQVLACGENSAPTGPSVSADEIPDGASSVAYSVLEEVTTSFSGIHERRRLIIRKEADWEAFWDDFTATVSPKPDRPDVDFSRHMVIAATMGQQSSGGYSISVEQVAEKDGTLYAAVQEVLPGVGCLATTALTAPAVAVSVPRRDGVVAFVDNELALPCAP